MALAHLQAFKFVFLKMHKNLKITVYTDINEVLNSSVSYILTLLPKGSRE